MKQDMILILDLGCEENPRLAREIRAMGVYTEIHPHDITADALAERRADLNEAIEKVRDRKAAIRARTARTYQRSLRILRANPTAKARQELNEALESLRKLGGRK